MEAPARPVASRISVGVPLGTVPLLPKMPERYTVRVNNHRVEFARPPDETVITPRELLAETRWHYNSCLVFEDIYDTDTDGDADADANADAETGSPPADLDKRRGEALDTIDIAEYDRVIVRNKRHL